MEIRQIIEGLECLVTKQHKCEGCPFNPHPGMDWPYGCGRGQGDAVKAAKRTILKHWEELGKPDCKAANHDAGGCLGYGHSENDDEPIDACKACELYTGNRERR